MPPLPQRNATVTKVAAGGGTGETYGGAPAAGPTLWENADARLNAYFRERRDRVQGGESANRVLDRQLIVKAADPAVEWKSGHVVTFTRKRTGETIVATVKLVQSPDLDGVPAELQTTRLTLEIA